MTDSISAGLSRRNPIPEPIPPDDGGSVGGAIDALHTAALWTNVLESVVEGIERRHGIECPEAFHVVGQLRRDLHVALARAEPPRLELFVAS